MRDPNNSIRIANFTELLINSQLSLTSLCKKVGIRVSNMSPILLGKRTFTDKLADKIEKAMGLNELSLSQPNDNTEISYPPRTCTIVTPNVIQSNHRKALTRIGINSKNLALILSHDTVMFDFPHEDNILKVFIDLSDKILLNDKLYLIKYRTHEFIRKFSNNYFITNAPDFYANILNNDLVEISGRVIAISIIQGV